MKKLLFPIITLVLTFSMILLMVIPAMAAPPVEPTVTTSLTGPDPAYVGVETSWTITIEIWGDDDEALSDVVVQGGIGADLDEITFVSPSSGTVVIGKKNVGQGKQKMRATMVTWDIGPLAVDEHLTLVLTVTTGENPKEKQEFTSVEEDHELDGGFSATYTYLGVEYETLETDPLLVDVILAP
jgi:hypothetical protein